MNSQPPLKLTEIQNLALIILLLAIYRHDFHYCKGATERLCENRVTTHPLVTESSVVSDKSLSHLIQHRYVSHYYTVREMLRYITLATV